MCFLNVFGIHDIIFPKMVQKNANKVIYFGDCIPLDFQMKYLLYTIIAFRNKTIRGQNLRYKNIGAAHFFSYQDYLQAK